MAFTYDPTALTTSTEAGRRNIVRFLVGDTDSTDQQMDDDEVLFALGQNSDNVNYAASYLCRALASKYSRKIDVQLSEVLQAKYSSLQSHYLSLADTLEAEAKKQSGLGFSAGGISRSEVTTARQLTDRVEPSFKRDQFWNPPGYDGTTDYE
jgi:hypothetical protein